MRSWQHLFTLVLVASVTTTTSSSPTTTTSSSSPTTTTTSSTSTVPCPGAPLLAQFGADGVPRNVPVNLPSNLFEQENRVFSGATVDETSNHVVLAMDDEQNIHPPLLVTIDVFQDEDNVVDIVQLDGFANVESVTWMFGSTFAVMEEHTPSITLLDLSLAVAGEAADRRFISKDAASQGSAAFLQEFVINFVPLIAQFGLEGLTYDRQRGAFYAVDEHTPKKLMEVQSNGFTKTLININNLEPVQDTDENAQIRDLSGLFFDHGARTIYALSRRSNWVVQLGTFDNVAELQLLSHLPLAQYGDMVPDRPEALAIARVPGSETEHVLIVAGRDTIFTIRAPCTASVASTGPSETCSNGQLDRLETDVDCGGISCPQCDIGSACNGPSDCLSHNCVGGSCSTVGRETPSPMIVFQPYSPPPSDQPRTPIPTIGPPTASTPPTVFVPTVQPSPTVPSSTPVTPPTGFVPTIQPSPTVPSSTPVAPPSTQTPNVQPSIQPSTLSPNTQPATEGPNPQPPTGAPNSQPSTGAPNAQPSTDAPNAQPSTQSPNVQPSTDAPNTQPSTQPPNAQPSTDAPNVQPSTDAPNAQPSTQPPNAQPSTEAPNTQPSTGAPNAQPSTEAPNAQPSTDAPNAQPSTDAPNAQPSTEAPNAQPSTDAPNAQPSTDAPNAQPSTQSPNVQPSTDAPNTQPSTDAPNAQPSTDAPNAQPSTEAPNAQPSTLPPTSTEAPNAQPSTDAPNVQPSTEAPNAQPSTPGPNTQPPNDQPPTNSPTPISIVSTSSPSFPTDTSRETCVDADSMCNEPETGCLRGVCTNVTVIDVCDNGVLDSATESDRDCGGQCPPCGVASTCGSDSDCDTGLVCLGGRCSGEVEGPRSHCSNGVQDSDETGKDCGGKMCRKCPRPSVTRGEEDSSKDAPTSDPESGGDWWIGLVAALCAILVCLCSVGLIRKARRKEPEEQYTHFPPNTP